MTLQASFYQHDKGFPLFTLRENGISHHTCYQFCTVVVGVNTVADQHLLIGDSLSQVEHLQLVFLCHLIYYRAESNATPTVRHWNYLAQIFVPSVPER